MIMDEKEQIRAAVQKTEQGVKPVHRKTISQMKEKNKKDSIQSRIEANGNVKVLSGTVDQLV